MDKIINLRERVILSTIYGVLFLVGGGAQFLNIFLLEPNGDPTLLISIILGVLLWLSGGLIFTNAVMLGLNYSDKYLRGAFYSVSITLNCLIGILYAGTILFSGLFDTWGGVAFSTLGSILIIIIMLIEGDEVNLEE